METNNWTDEKVYFFLKNLGLSHREIDVTRALFEIKTDREIGVRLNIAQSTVHSHKINIYSKTKTHDRAELILFLYRKGLFRD
jgi:DNA-binding NarL/FixJ family response regulator